jgi:hypothetical protein
MHEPRHLQKVLKDEHTESVRLQMSNYRGLHCDKCKQTFWWPKEDACDACPLCGCGAKQKVSKLPKKRLTHKQIRKLRGQMSDCVVLNDAAWQDQTKKGK